MLVSFTYFHLYLWHYFKIFTTTPCLHTDFFHLILIQRLHWCPVWKSQYRHSSPDLTSSFKKIAELSSDLLWSWCRCVCVCEFYRLRFFFSMDVCFSNALSSVCSQRVEMISFHHFLTREPHPVGMYCVIKGGWLTLSEWQNLISTVYISYQLLPWLQSYVLVPVSPGWDFFSLQWVRGCFYPMFRNVPMCFLWLIK